MKKKKLLHSTNIGSSINTKLQSTKSLQSTKIKHQSTKNQQNNPLHQSTFANVVVLSQFFYYFSILIPYYHRPITFSGKTNNHFIYVVFFTNPQRTFFLNAKKLFLKKLFIF